MPLGLIGRAGRAMAGYGARNAAAGGYMTRGIGAVGRFVGRNPQATMYGGMMGIGAGIGAFSDSDSVIGNSLQWGAMGAGLRYGAAGLRGASAARRFASRTGNTASLREQAQMARMTIGYSGRADWARMKALGRSAKAHFGPKTAGSAPVNPVASTVNRGSSAAAEATSASASPLLLAASAGPSSLGFRSPVSNPINPRVMARNLAVPGNVAAGFAGIAKGMSPSMYRPNMTGSMIRDPRRLLGGYGSTIRRTRKQLRAIR